MGATTPAPKSRRRSPAQPRRAASAAAPRAQIAPAERIGVTHLTAEYWPFARTGGLGEAVSGLATCQAAMGLPTTVIMPLYQIVRETTPSLERTGRRSPSRWAGTPSAPGCIARLPVPVRRSSSSSIPTFSIAPGSTATTTGTIRTTPAGSRSSHSRRLPRFPRSPQRRSCCTRTTGTPRWRRYTSAPRSPRSHSTGGSR